MKRISFRILEISITAKTFLMSISFIELYEPEDVMTCDSVDKDPLNRCQPYVCDIRYDGLRSIYNFTTNRCEKIPKCVAEPTKPDQLIVSKCFSL